MEFERQFVEKIKDLIDGIEYFPKIGVVLGSGLDNFTNSMEKIGTIGFDEIAGFPKATAPGHEGKFVFGYVHNIPVVAVQGRLHCYEGYTSKEVVMPIRILKKIGIQVLMLTNAAGGIRANLSPGKFMLIKDHISSFITSPLIGPNDEAWGPRFPDMSDVYNKELRNIICGESEQLGLSVSEGVYIQLPGPNFETAAEINMCKIIGADAVGMSTVIEAIFAHYAGMRVCGVSYISNYACGISEKKLSIEDIERTSKQIETQFQNLVCASIKKMKEQNVI